MTIHCAFVPRGRFSLAFRRRGDRSGSGSGGNLGSDGMNGPSQIAKAEHRRRSLRRVRHGGARFPWQRFGDRGYERKQFGIEPREGIEPDRHN